MWLFLYCPPFIYYTSINKIVVYLWFSCSVLQFIPSFDTWQLLNWPTHVPRQLSWNTSSFIYQPKHNGKLSKRFIKI